jgi:hypothetical protein
MDSGMELNVGGTAYRLREGADLVALRTAIVEASKSRGAFVSIHPVGHGPMDILITRHTSVHFETVCVVTAIPDDWDFNGEEATYRDYEALGFGA